VPVAHLARAAIAAYVTQQLEAAPRLPSFVGAFASGQTDTAERPEELLFETLEAELGLQPLPRRPRVAKQRSPQKR
jgi:hypothetical protein